MYDFQNLSSDDFERLTADLLGKALDLRFESFRTGRDGGIDLRYSPTRNATVIVQCKRYQPDAWNRLLRVMQKEELPKLHRMRPARYILATSCALSPQNKDDLASALHPYVTTTGDIFGASDLNALIADHKEVERRHFKLWLGSTAVLERVLHARIFNYSLHEVERLRRDISRYVVHDGFYRALELLDDSHHCVISGMPGIGKTTAARLLLAHYLNEGYEVIAVTGDVEDAWAAIDASDSNTKQIVYYDDFLGQIGQSQKLGKNEDVRLIALMEHCESSTSKRFVLTTREYLFDQALAAHEPLGRAAGQIRKALVKLDDYTELVRARLLINHLAFSNLAAEYLEELVRSRTYQNLINHRNFLPRLIEGICTTRFIADKSPAEFCDAALKRLADPASIWRHPFTQLTRESQLLLYTLASVSGELEKSALEAAYVALRMRSGGVTSPRLFNEVLHEVEGSFTLSQRYPASAGSVRRQPAYLVGFINPSAREFVLTDLLSRPDLFRMVLESAIHFEQALFWDQATQTFVGISPDDAAAPLLDAILKVGFDRLGSSIPEVSGWRDKHLQFEPTIPRITRMRRLLGSTAAIDKTGERNRLLAAYAKQNVHWLQSIYASSDVYWLPELTTQLIEALRAYDGDWLGTLQTIRHLLQPGQYGADLRLLRYHWQAADELLKVQETPADEYEDVREKFLAKVDEAADEVTDDLSADEIEEAISDIERLESELDEGLAARRAQLESWREAAQERERRAEEQAEKEEELSDAYSSDDQNDEDVVDIDGMFAELLASLPEASADGGS